MAGYRLEKMLGLKFTPTQTESGLTTFSFFENLQLTFEKFWEILKTVWPATCIVFVGHLGPDVIRMATPFVSINYRLNRLSQSKGL